MGEVSTVDFFPLAWVIHFARALMTFNVINAMNKKKYNMPKTFCIFIGVCMVYSYLTLQLNDKSQKVEYTCLILYFVIQFVLVLFLYDSKLYLKLTSIAFSFLTMPLSTILYFSSFSYLFGADYTASFANSLSVLSLFTVSLFMVIFSFFVVFLIELAKKKFKKSLNHNIKYIYFYLFPLTHFFGFQLIYVSQQLFIKENKYYPERVSLIACIYFVICFAIDISIIFAVDYLEKKEEENIKYKKLLTKNELDYQQFLQLKNEKERFRKIRHDISNILTTAAGFIEIEKPEKALEIIRNADNDIHLSANREICKNEAINTIYTIKHQQALEKGIDFIISVREDVKINIPDYDLCRVLTNLIDNQINALENTDSKIFELSIICTMNDIIIKGTNEYIPSAKSNKSDPNHGYGQKIISSIAKKYNGSYKGEISNGKFITSTILENKGRPE